MCLFLISSHFILKSELKGQSIIELTQVSYLSSFCFWRISRDSECPEFSKLSASCWQVTTLFPAASNWCWNVLYLAQSCFWRKTTTTKVFWELFFPKHIHSAVTETSNKLTIFRDGESPEEDINDWILPEILPKTMRSYRLLAKHEVCDADRRQKHDYQG